MIEKPSDLDNFITAIHPTKKDEKTDALETELESVKRKLHETRFYWLLTTIVLVDVNFFSNMKSATGPIAIIIIEAIGLIEAARKCGVEIVYNVTERLLDGWSKRKGPDNQ